MRALSAAAIRSARRMSGRRRNRSAGIPATALLRRRGNGCFCQSCLHLFGRNAEQHTQAVATCARKRILVGGICRGAFAISVVLAWGRSTSESLGAGIEPCLGNLQRAALELGVVAQQLDLPLQHAVLHIIAGDIAEQRDEHIIVIEYRRIQLSGRRLDRTPVTGPRNQAPRPDRSLSYSD